MELDKINIQEIDKKELLKVNKKKLKKSIEKKLKDSDNIINKKSHDSNKRITK